MALFLNLLLLLFILGIFAFEVMLFVEMVRLSRGDVPYVPSRTEVVRAVVAAEVLTKDGLILDLGCGDGKALRMFAAAGFRGPLMGYERAPFPWMLGCVLSRLRHAPVTLRLQHFRHAPLERARGVYLFLMPKPLAALAPALAARLPPGTPVVSAEFQIVDWTPERVLTARGVTAKEVKIYVYRSKMNKH